MQPAEQLADACVNLLNKDKTNVPILMCLPVTYAFGGTTNSIEKQIEEQFTGQTARACDEEKQIETTRRCLK